MKYWKIVYPGLPAQAMAIYPFMLFKNGSLSADVRIIRHETIHFKQQVELLFIFFYLIYGLHYLVNLIKLQDHHMAYLNICFEKEAYENDNDSNYLTNRKPYTWLITD